MLKKWMGYQVLALLICCAACAQSDPGLHEVPVFENGKDGYACYRIPAIIRAPNGDLLAFAEGRVGNCGDFGDVDLVMRTSRDQGLTWSPLTVVAENNDLQAGNPAPVVDFLDPDFPNGRIFLVYNTGDRSEWDIREGKGSREVWFRTSADNGRTWSTPANITSMVKKAGWRTFANTPGHALQLKEAPRRGRIYVAANHAAGGPLKDFMDYRAHGFFSDDHGKTWQSGASLEVPGSNESIAVELPGGTILQNIRQQSGYEKARLMATSNDGGLSWDSAFYHIQLPDPVCQASMLDYKTKDGREVLLFSNPESTRKREKMTVKASFDHGRTWPASRLIRQGPSGYSDLVIQRNGDIGLLYEHGSNGGIYYAAFTWDWLMQGRQEPYAPPPLAGMEAPQGLFQLATPDIDMDSVWFRNSASITLRLGLDPTEIRYTLDGSEPDMGSELYTGVLRVDNTGTIRAKAFGRCCRPSREVRLDFIRIASPLNPVSGQLENGPAPAYPGRGWSTLTDQIKGSPDFKDGAWLGFEGTDAVLTLELPEERTLNRIRISALSDPGSWIFPPSRIEVLTSADGMAFESLAVFEPEKSDVENPAGGRIYAVNVGNKKSKFWKIAVSNFGKLPDGHPGAGAPAWLFLDEILAE